MHDIGCGDGRLLLAAAARGARGVGVEYDAVFAERATAAVAAKGLQDTVSIVHGDAVEVVDTSTATVVFVYLVPEGLAKVAHHLQAARDRGARIVSNMFGVPGWTPTKTERIKGLPVYLYAGPATK